MLVNIGVKSIVVHIEMVSPNTNTNTNVNTGMSQQQFENVMNQVTQAFQQIANAMPQGGMAGGGN